MAPQKLPGFACVTEIVYTPPLPEEHGYTHATQAYLCKLHKKYRSASLRRDLRKRLQRVQGGFPPTSTDQIAIHDY